MFNNPFSMVVAIVAIVMFAKVMSAKYRHERSSGYDGLMDGSERPALIDNSETIALKNEVKALRERVVVLERIATDNHDAMRIDEEIARLRDR
jgi:hypothetical protein